MRCVTRETDQSGCLLMLMTEPPNTEQETKNRQRLCKKTWAGARAPPPHTAATAACRARSAAFPEGCAEDKEEVTI